MLYICLIHFSLIYYDFDIAYAEADYYQRPVYNTYKKMVLDNLNQESIRLNQIIERLDEYEVDNRQKKYNLYFLIITIVILFFL